MKRISTSKEQLFEMRLSADLFEERFGPRSKPFEPPFSDWPEDDDEPKPIEGENIEDYGAFRDRPENFADVAKFKEAPKYVDNDRAEILLEDYTGGDGMLVWEGDPRSPDGAYLIDNVSGQTIGYLQGDRFMYNGDWSDGLPVELIGQIAQKLDRPERSMDMPRRKRQPRPEPSLRDEMEMPPRTTHTKVAYWCNTCKQETPSDGYGCLNPKCPDRNQNATDYSMNEEGQSAKDQGTEEGPFYFDQEAAGEGLFTRQLPNYKRNFPNHKVETKVASAVTIPWDLALEITGKLAGYRSTCDESTALGAQNCQDIDRVLGQLKEAMGVGDGQDWQE